MLPRQQIRSRTSMSSGDRGGDLFETIARRAPVVARLAERPQGKADLEATLSRSRSTVDRAIRELGSRSLVESDGEGRYRLTVAGRVAWERYERTLGSFDAIARARPFLENVPRDAPLSSVLFDGATVHLPTRSGSVPDARAHELLVDRLVDRLESADRAVGFSPAEPGPRIRNTVVSRATSDDFEAVVVISPALTAYLLSNSPDQMVALVESDGVDLAEASDLPYGLVVSERDGESMVQLFVYGETARLGGLLENDDPAAVDWAESVYHEYLEVAKPLEPPT